LSGICKRGGKGHRNTGKKKRITRNVRSDWGTGKTRWKTGRGVSNIYLTGGTGRKENIEKVGDWFEVKVHDVATEKNVLKKKNAIGCTKLKNRVRGERRPEKPKKKTTGDK